MKKRKRRNNKTCLIILIVIAITLIIGGLSLVLISLQNKVKIKHIKPNTKYENFNNGLISMKIPAGWVVKVNEKADITHYTFMAVNPENPDYQIFVNLKFEGFLKSNSAKKWFKNIYGDSHFSSKMPVLEQLSTECYFKNTFDAISQLNNTETFKIPALKNFTVTQKLGMTPFGGDILSATYINDSSKPVEGIFGASPKDFGAYYVRENFVSGKKIDAGYRNVYNTFFITAPEGDFVNWEKALITSLNSIQFSEKFIKEFKQSQDNELKTIQSNSKIYSKISESIMTSWEKRNMSYDIQSQKRSDVTLGYERVYDVKKGKIYKAYNGFSDDYKGKRYLPATDDMYVKPIDGYIEK